MKVTSVTVLSGDPYQLDYGKGRLDISEADWKKMYDRLDFMRPQFIRVMTNTTSVMQDGVLYPERGLEHLSHILDYCQSRDVTVMFGDWGGGMVDARKEVIHEKNLSAAAEYVRFLIEEKGYSCIKYYNLVNEPNGYWSSTDGKYSLWARAIRFFYGELQKNKLAGKLWLWGLMLQSERLITDRLRPSRPASAQRSFRCTPPSTVRSW